MAAGACSGVTYPECDLVRLDHSALICPDVPARKRCSRCTALLGCAAGGRIVTTVKANKRQVAISKRRIRTIIVINGTIIVINGTNIVITVQKRQAVIS